MNELTQILTFENPTPEAQGLEIEVKDAKGEVLMSEIRGGNLKIMIKGRNTNGRCSDQECSDSI